MQVIKRMATKPMKQYGDTQGNKRKNQVVELDVQQDFSRKEKTSKHPRLAVAMLRRNCGQCSFPSSKDISMWKCNINSISYNRSIYPRVRETWVWISAPSLNATVISTSFSLPLCFHFLICGMQVMIAHTCQNLRKIISQAHRALNHTCSINFK